MTKSVTKAWKACGVTDFVPRRTSTCPSVAMHILGVLLPENQLAKVRILNLSPVCSSLRAVQHALQNFFGVGPMIASRICARMAIHDRCKVRDLTQGQTTSLTAFLSSPSTYPEPKHVPLASLKFKAPAGKPLPTPAPAPKERKDTVLKNLKIETELKKEIRENIAHQRMIGSYVGRRHMAHLPVRGQRSKTNAQTAKKLNRIERHL